MARYISDENADSIGVDFQEVIEVARDGGHRPVSGRDGRSGDPGHGLGKDRRLDLPRDAQLSIHGEQTPRVGEHTPHRDCAEACDEGRKTEGFQILCREC